MPTHSPEFAVRTMETPVTSERQADSFVEGQETARDIQRERDLRMVEEEKAGRRVEILTMPAASFDPGAISEVVGSHYAGRHTEYAFVMEKDGQAGTLGLSKAMLAIYPEAQEGLSRASSGPQFLDVLRTLPEGSRIQVQSVMEDRHAGSPSFHHSPDHAEQAWQGEPQKHRIGIVPDKEKKDDCYLVTVNYDPVANDEGEIVSVEVNALYERVHYRSLLLQGRESGEELTVWGEDGAEIEIEAEGEPVPDATVFRSEARMRVVRLDDGSFAKEIMDAAGAWKPDDIAIADEFMAGYLDNLARIWALQEGGQGEAKTSVIWRQPDGSLQLWESELVFNEEDGSMTETHVRRDVSIIEAIALGVTLRDRETGEEVILSALSKICLEEGGGGRRAAVSFEDSDGVFADGEEFRLLWEKGLLDKTAMFGADGSPCTPEQAYEWLCLVPPEAEDSEDGRPATVPEERIGRESVRLPADPRPVSRTSADSVPSEVRDRPPRDPIRVTLSPKVGRPERPAQILPALRWSVSQSEPRRAKDFDGRVFSPRLILSRSAGRIVAHRIEPVPAAPDKALSGHVEDKGMAAGRPNGPHGGEESVPAAPRRAAQVDSLAVPALRASVGSRILAGQKLSVDMPIPARAQSEQAVSRESRRAAAPRQDNPDIKPIRPLPSGSLGLRLDLPGIGLPAAAPSRIKMPAASFEAPVFSVPLAGASGSGESDMRESVGETMATDAGEPVVQGGVFVAHASASLEMPAVSHVREIAKDRERTVEELFARRQPAEAPRPAARVASSSPAAVVPVAAASVSVAAVPVSAPAVQAGDDARALPVTPARARRRGRDQAEAALSESVKDMEILGIDSLPTARLRALAELRARDMRARLRAKLGTVSMRPVQVSPEAAGTFSVLVEAVDRLGEAHSLASVIPES